MQLSPVNPFGEYGCLPPLTRGTPRESMKLWLTCMHRPDIPPVKRPVREIYDNYCLWCREYGFVAIHLRVFSTWLSMRGFPSERVYDPCVSRRLRLKSSDKMVCVKAIGLWNTPRIVSMEASKLI